jgi:hypothetical protein
MTNWHNPILEAAEGRSSYSLSDNLETSHSSLPDSRSHQICTRPWRRVFVSYFVHSSYVYPTSHLTPVGNLS